jgi:uncharacterized membrane protein
MNGEHFFSDRVAEKIWAQYFRRLDRLIRPLDEVQRRELTLEIKSHLLESFRGETAGSEAERLLNALERLGEPESFIGPMRSDRLLAKASKSMKPKDVLKSLYYHLAGGTRKMFLGILFVLGYILDVGLVLMAVLKPIIPNHVGLLLFNDGDVIFGFGRDTSNIKTDVFGYALIPICLVLAAGLYFGLTKLLKALRRSR